MMMMMVMVTMMVNVCDDDCCLVMKVILVMFRLSASKSAFGTVRHADFCNDLLVAFDPIYQLCHGAMIQESTQNISKSSIRRG